jgi:hypothetical protein
MNVFAQLPGNCCGCWSGIFRIEISTGSIGERLRHSSVDGWRLLWAMMSFDSVLNCWAAVEQRRLYETDRNVVLTLVT